MKEIKNVPNVIIEANSVRAEFDLSEGRKPRNLVIKGTTADGREAFFLAGKGGFVTEDEALKKAKRRLRGLKKIILIWKLIFAEEFHLLHRLAKKQFMHSLRLSAR